MQIAIRHLKILENEHLYELSIRLFLPEESEGSWMCRYSIHWPDGIWESYAAGHDSIQAILIAMQKISAELYASRYHQSGQLSCDEPGNGYGFPLTHNLRDLAVGDDKKI